MSPVRPGPVIPLVKQTLNLKVTHTHGCASVSVPYVCWFSTAVLFVTLNVKCCNHFFLPPFQTTSCLCPLDRLFEHVSAVCALLGHILCSCFRYKHKPSQRLYRLFNLYTHNTGNCSSSSFL